MGGFWVFVGVAQGLADEDEEQKGKACGQGGDDGNEGFFGFGFALGGLGRLVPPIELLLRAGFGAIDAPLRRERRGAFPFF